jgi:uncharacterized protein (DUF488 family)
LTDSFVSTIGFTKTTAEGFFERLLRSKVRTVLDIRLNNTSQLAGFAKAKDLQYLLSKIADIKYRHLPILAPTDDILTAFKKEKGDWNLYESRFLRLMAEREIENKLKPEMLDQACLLCSEDTPHHCHRRLVCEYLNGKWGNVLRVNHL